MRIPWLRSRGRRCGGLCITRLRISLQWMVVMLTLGLGIAVSEASEASGFASQQPASPSHAMVYFSALDKQELPVMGLDAADFILRINHIQAPMEGFKPARSYNSRSIPVVFWILVDFNPNINATMIANQAEAAAGALDQIHAASALGVKLVSDRMQVLAPLGSDSEDLRQAFQGFKKRRTELNSRRDEGAILLGPGGMLRAIESSVKELVDYVNSQPDLAGKEVFRAILVLSDANINPSYNRKTTVDLAVSQSVYVYPVFIPRTAFGRWVEAYFELGQKTGGVGSVFGAMRPGSDILNLPRENLNPNALMFSIMNMLRDLNGKYSFALPVPEAAVPAQLEVRCRRPGVTVRLPLKKLPKSQGLYARPGQAGVEAAVPSADPHRK